MLKLDKNVPIGVFDSGIGGLTIVKVLRDILPTENIIYFGDIARLPYGTKSDATIKHFAMQTANFLIKQNVKALVIACNTISAVAKDEILQIAGNIPVVDVISSGALASAFVSKNNRLGIIATPATINSKAYVHKIHDLNKDINVFSQACSLFVPLIEEGFLKHPALELIAHDYLVPLIKNDIDTLVLGCTHYPLIKPILQQILGAHVNIIDPAFETCQKLSRVLHEQNLLNDVSHKSNINYFVTEISPNFIKIAKVFLNDENIKLELVSLDI
jgi:glutamate racemase